MVDNGVLEIKAQRRLDALADVAIPPRWHVGNDAGVVVALEIRLEYPRDEVTFCRRPLAGDDGVVVLCRVREFEFLGNDTDR